MKSIVTRLPGQEEFCKELEKLRLQMILRYTILYCYSYLYIFLRCLNLNIKMKCMLYFQIDFCMTNNLFL